VKVADFFRLAIRALLDRKIRSVLTILGIAVGSAVILALIASSSGLSAGITSNIEKTGANVLTLQTASGFFSSGSTSTYQLSELDVNWLKTLPHVAHVYPYYSYTASIGSGGAILRASVIGIDFSSLSVLYNGLTIAQGTMPSVSDTTSALLGYSIANPTSGSVVGINQMVSMSISGIQGSKSSVSYAVLAGGILAQYGSSLFANIDNTVYISIQAAQFLSKTPYYSGIYVVVDSTDNANTVQTAITNNYSNNVRVISPGQILSSLTSITGMLTLFLGGIGGVSLFVAAIGIVNTMYVSVIERTREIGILKALGYRPRQIMGLFLSEAALTGIIGGICGLALGYVLAYLIGGLFGGLGNNGGGGSGFGGGAGFGAALAIQPVFSPELILFSSLFPILLATIAGLYPAWRASRMNAVNALKYE
jgi:putative ABC transport system permease protein